MNKSKHTFTTPVSMEVTLEQYRRDLEKPLEELGYKWQSSSYTPEYDFSYNYYNILVTNYSKLGDLGGVDRYSSKLNNTYQIKEYNPELFLALAAMTEGEDPIVGEYVIITDKGCSIDGGLDDYNRGDLVKLYKSNLSNYNYKFSITPDGKGTLGFYKGQSDNYLRKPTKEELIEHFTSEQFKQHSMKTRQISYRQAQSIIDIACSTWKDTLAKKWSKEIVLKESILIEEEEYKEMREACTKEQNELFDEIFGKDEVIYDVSKPTLFKTSCNQIGMIVYVGDEEDNGIHYLSAVTLGLSNSPTRSCGSYESNRFTEITKENISKNCSLTITEIIQFDDHKKMSEYLYNHFNN